MRLLSIIVFTLVSMSLVAQSTKYTRQDSLRGSITSERSWWNLTYYHLSLNIDPDKKSIKGSNLVQYEVLNNHNRMQIDLQEPLMITSVTQNKENLNFEREGNAYFINLKADQNQGDINSVLIEFEGVPVVSKNPPWSAGFTWKKDNNGIDFFATSCQGEGASIWWPNKDHMYDEVDSMLMSITVPEHLTDVSNGRLRSIVQNDDKTRTFNWFVANPINNYGVNINVGDYVQFSKIYNGENGPLDMDYYVLRDNLDKAKEQFKQAPKMMEAFEHWFGPYPFYEDSYKLVEAPYLGMEHQSSITYGNDYGNGYRGRDVSGSGWGLKFDFIIIHESGHEWFANNITYKDIADMWVHEGFTAYSESIYTEYFYGKEAGADYVIGTRKNIGNKAPIIGDYGVNSSGSGDMYSKGANMLHTIRSIINDDELWRSILRGLNEEFYHSTVTTKEIEYYISDHARINLSKVFDQYLRNSALPNFEYSIDGDKLTYRWTKVVAGFDMPVYIDINNAPIRLEPTTQKQSIELINVIKSMEVNRNFYVTNEKIN
jgi:aminopeptidase N